MAIFLFKKKFSFWGMLLSLLLFIGSYGTGKFLDELLPRIGISNDWAKSMLAIILGNWFNFSLVVIFCFFGSVAVYNLIHDKKMEKERKRQKEIDAQLEKEKRELILIEKEKRELILIEKEKRELILIEKEKRELILKTIYSETYPIVPDISLIGAIKYIQKDVRFKLDSTEDYHIRDILWKLIQNGDLHIWAKNMPEDKYPVLLIRQQIVNCVFSANNWESTANILLIGGNYMYDIRLSKQEIVKNYDNFKENT